MVFKERIVFGLYSTTLAHSIIVPSMLSLLWLKRSMHKIAVA